MGWVDEIGKISEAREGLNSADVKTEIVVLPSTYEEVAEIVKFALKTGISIYPFSKNKHHIGSKVKANIGLSLEKLNKVLTISEEDLYVTVHAGADFKLVNEELKSHGLQIPFIYTGSVGGFASTNLPSILTWYGYPKEWLLGAKIVTGLGEVIKSGGNTTKFSSGYKIWKVLSGSLGWLGIYLELNIRLVPYQDFHFEEVNKVNFSSRPLGVVGIKSEGTKIYEIRKGKGMKIEIPENFDASIVTVRGKEIDTLKEIEGEYCVAYYGSGLIRCIGVNVERLRRSGYTVIIERNCGEDCFGYSYETLNLLKKSLDPNGVFFGVFR